ncbi:MAG: hypothetical protein ACM3PY_09025, partial [Omnitrophica WOR_2 bacterium]
KQRWGELAKFVKGRKLIDNKGCKFADRCPVAFDQCTKSPPPLYVLEGNHAVTCYQYQNSPQMEKTQLGTLFKDSTVPARLRNEV